MTAEQRKWYAMGANDMEAGRLVSDPLNAETPNEFQRKLAVQNLEAENESLREQLEAATHARDHASSDAYERGFRAGKGAAEAKLALREAELVVEERCFKDAEAKLAEAERVRDNLSQRSRELWEEKAEVEYRLSEAEKERDAAEKGRDYYSAKNAERWASMDRARELAKSLATDDLPLQRTRLAELARLLSGDE